jgi:ATP/maltotriose-dependent transcriptional regulator MalT
MVRIRMMLALGAPIEALHDSLGSLDRPASPTQEGELAAARALAAACAGDLDGFEVLLVRAGDHRWGTQAIVLCTCGALIAELARGGDASHEARALIEVVTSTGWMDPLITACRASPEIVPLLASDLSFESTIRGALERSRDYELLGRRDSRAQSRPALSGPRLSDREEEVYGLLCQGLSNKGIAQALFISDVTVKVHLRHIYRKLRVRTRLEAVARGGAALDTDPV